MRQEHGNGGDIMEANVSALLNRLGLSRLTNASFGGKRDMYEILGYNDEPDFKDYFAKYLRQDISQRIINAFPDAIWNEKVTVTENGDDDVITEFEKAFSDLAKRTKLFHYLNRLDKLSGIGRYAVLLIGVRDGSDLEKPMGFLEGGVDDVIYLMPFSEDSATIHRYDENPGSERYGLPDMYKLCVGGYTSKNSTQMPRRELFAHHSRLLHISEGLCENDVFGIPKLEPVLNRLDDLEKVVGGSAEIFWLNGRGGLNLNAQKDTEIVNPDELHEHADDYINQLSRVLRTKGMDVQTLELGIHDPDQHVAVILDLISGATGIPKRILIGSERGELASSQDESNWWSRVNERRNNYCDPLVLRPFIDRLMLYGALPSVDEYDVVWPDLVSASEVDKAEIALKRANAISAYMNSQGGSLIVPPDQFVEKVLNLEYKAGDIEAELAKERDQMEQDAE